MELKAAKKLLDLVIQMGALLIQSGAETYRVEETLAYVLRAYGAKDPSVYMVDTLLLVSFQAAQVKSDSELTNTNTALASDAALTPAGPATVKVAEDKALESVDFETLTASWRVRNKSINLERLRCLSNLSYRIVRNDLSLDAFQNELEQIRNLPLYSDLQILGGSMGVAFGFGLMFTLGLWQSTLIALITCPVIALYRLLRAHINEFVLHAVCAACGAFLVIAVMQLGYLNNFGKSVAAVLMALMPGALFTNGLRDLIMGDLNAGTNKLIQALLVGVALALGAAVVLITWGLSTLQ